METENKNDNAHLENAEVPDSPLESVLKARSEVKALIKAVNRRKRESKSIESENVYLQSYAGSLVGSGVLEKKRMENSLNIPGSLRFSQGSHNDKKRYPSLSFEQLQALKFRKIGASTTTHRPVLYQRDLNRTNNSRDIGSVKGLLNISSGNSVDGEHKRGALLNLISVSRNTDSIESISVEKRKMAFAKAAAPRLQKHKIIKEELFVPNSSRHTTQVELVPFDFPLTAESKSLIIDGCSRRTSINASPFFDATEFDPRCATDEMVLMSILEDEMERIDAPLENRPKATFWKALCNTFYRLLHFGQFTKEDYIARYTWEKFFDPELYYADKANNENDDEGEINYGMVPGGDLDVKNILENRGKMAYAFVPGLT
ncbi:hypothetical protein FOA43_003038 [Brettanomyces nanus]|uniref:Uncharacterized protein n=1 Tax=Eeniella nana TaxID=13502 RepID=A0A875S7J2_EENNA|nr:uncharacterized protein FOA43_003038 [Brettanomyces nanus]QPG75679.1 hypothetical protein FOA43_003038 [Brettanomyces nanus]